MGEMKTAGIPGLGAGVRRAGIPARHNDRLVLSLLLSLVLHALVLMLQFGSPGLGLPWLGLPGDERGADIPALRAVLRAPVVAAASHEETAPAKPVASAVRPAAVPAIPIETLPPPHALLPTEPVVATAVLREAPLQNAQKEYPLARVAEEPPPVAEPAPGAAVLSTDKDSPWRTSVAQTADAEDATLREMRAAEERTKEEAQERLRVEELTRSKEEQRLAEQAVAAKAREVALANDLAARALARERREEAGRSDAPTVATAAAASPTAGKPEGGREAGAGPATGSGADLAQRALARAKNAMPVPVPAPPENLRRRGNLLGRDPRDIQLAFYGEGWRQKIERIGGMNFPRLSRNRTYDSLVVTVSINSDGTLAGVYIDKSSGYRELDEAVRRIVEMSAPFAAFPPDLKRNYDVVDITRNWSFQEERPRISGE